MNHPSSVSPLSAEKLCAVIDESLFVFETTADLLPDHHIIGQPRGIRAIEFGIGIQSQGYNVFVMGAAGTGRSTAIERFLVERSVHGLAPADWVYVHNFMTPHQPRAIELPAGDGAVFQALMAALISNLSADLPQAFDTDAYKETIQKIRGELDEKQSILLHALGQKAAAQGFSLVSSASGFGLMAVKDGRQLTPEEVQTLPIEEQHELEERHELLMSELEDVLYDLHHLEGETRQHLRLIDRQVAETAIQHHFAELREQYQENKEVLLYLNEVHQDVLNQIDDFAPQLDSEEDIDLRRYEVNLFVDNARRQGAPVVQEMNPTFYNLFGRLEYEMEGGVVFTHFTNLKAGSLHQANGGYLILQAQDLLKNADAWETLKRSLKTREIQNQPAATMETSQVLAKSLQPEAIPLNLKIVLLGSPFIYFALYENDEEFRDLFKVRADFEAMMVRDVGHIQEYAQFVATRCHEEGLLHFDKTAVSKIIEFGSRQADDQHKLTTRFGAVADLVREASYWAGVNGRSHTTAADVQQALAERAYRTNALEERMQEEILQGMILIATEGSVVGQVNGLSVVEMGDYHFGQPSRITARTFMGEDGVIHIERETEMSGPLHEKGVLTLTGYLGGTYAQNQPLSLTASLTFEQNYGGVEGDSASLAELCVLLSSIGNIAIKQSIAVTGSVNQRGEVQPIGGVNEKIEGFFRICQARGLTGQQGVIIPASNVINLMLHEDVITAVSAGQFYIWPVKTVEEGIYLLTGIPVGERDASGNYPPDTVHHTVQSRLRQLAEELKAFGDDNSEEE